MSQNRRGSTAASSTPGLAPTLPRGSVTGPSLAASPSHSLAPRSHLRPSLSPDPTEKWGEGRSTLLPRETGTPRSSPGRRAPHLAPSTVPSVSLSHQGACPGRRVPVLLHLPTAETGVQTIFPCVPAPDTPCLRPGSRTQTPQEPLGPGRGSVGAQCCDRDRALADTWAPPEQHTGRNWNQPVGDPLPSTTTGAQPQYPTAHPPNPYWSGWAPPSFMLPGGMAPGPSPPRGGGIGSRGVPGHQGLFNNKTPAIVEQYSPASL